MEQTTFHLPPVQSAHQPAPVAPCLISPRAPMDCKLPPIGEVLSDIDLSQLPDKGKQRNYDHNLTPREHAPNFPEAQSLLPAPGRWRSSYNAASANPSESSGGSEYSERRSSYASPTSSASIASNKGSPIMPAAPQYPGQHRPPASEYSNGHGYLYAGPPDQANRGAPSPTRASHYPSPYGAMAPQEYVGPYGRMQQSGPPGAGGYNGGYDAMGDYGDGKQKRRRGNLPKATTDILRQWFQDHLAHPYPTEEEKQSLMQQTQLSMSQISNWFINARRRSLPAVQRPPALNSETRG